MVPPVGLEPTLFQIRSLVPSPLGDEGKSKYAMQLWRIKLWFQRMDRVCADLNVFLLVIVIGLSALVFSVMAMKSFITANQAHGWIHRVDVTIPEFSSPY
jgi:hypothetical protein